jgi:hypothetical protein
VSAACTAISVCGVVKWLAGSGRFSALGIDRQAASHGQGWALMSPCGMIQVVVLTVVVAVFSP